ncbi:cytochrome P450 27C1 [Aplysia californica]|uniref:Cytochrome P450 27C1 n=1 Tax=Aplysia californica TaxID=6500 RepID=A0ABM1VUD8_APLCA|nr:cytochrome P450 27C1 [Aplysia californica]
MAMLSLCKILSRQSPLSRTLTSQFWRTTASHASSSPKGDSHPAQSDSDLKPFSSIPGLTGLSTVGNTLRTLRNNHQLHQIHERQAKQFGGLWRATVGSWNLLFIANPRGVRDVIRCEGKRPERPGIPQWTEYYSSTNKPLGIIMSQGKEWQRMRRTLDKPILRPALFRRHVDSLSEVSSDFVDKLDTLRDVNGDVSNIQSELFKWSLESACTVLINKRLGCLKSQPPTGVQEFINATLYVFEYMSKRMLFPTPFLKLFYNKEWRTFERNFGILFKVAEEQITQGMEDTSLTEESFIGHILSRDNLTLKEVYSNVTELMFASVDTTSNTAHALLWILARNPSIQQQCYQEMNEVLPDWKRPSYSDLDKLKYTTGLIKETLRLFPPAYVTTRTFSEDGDVCGYKVPAGVRILLSFYPMGRDPNLFPDPEVVKPERWIRHGETSHSEPDPFSSIPFGIGLRSCIGRRIAMAEAQLLCTEIVRRYCLTSMTSEFNLTTRLTLSATAPIQLTLTPRT